MSQLRTELILRSIPFLQSDKTQALFEKLRAWVLDDSQNLLLNLAPPTPPIGAVSGHGTFVSALTNTGAPSVPLTPLQQQHIAANLQQLASAQADAAARASALQMTNAASGLPPAVSTNQSATLNAAPSSPTNVSTSPSKRQRSYPIICWRGRIITSIRFPWRRHPTGRFCTLLAKPRYKILPSTIYSWNLPRNHTPYGSAEMYPPSGQNGSLRYASFYGGFPPGENRHNGLFPLVWDHSGFVNPSDSQVHLSGSHNPYRCSTPCFWQGEARMRHVGSIGQEHWRFQADFHHQRSGRALLYLAG